MLAQVLKPHVTLNRKLHGYNESNHHFSKPTVICAIRPGAEVVRGWCTLNRSTVCTVGAVAPGAGFLRLKECVSQVHREGVRIVEPEIASLKRETSRRPNFFIFRPIEVPKEPRQGFWDAGKPLEQSICQFEHYKTCF
jgi:hypothetical protein